MSGRLAGHGPEGKEKRKGLEGETQAVLIWLICDISID
jgi:hypothetical protein